MASFLTTNGVSHHLEEIVKRARESLFLVSPYLKLNSRFRDLLAHRMKRGLRVRLVYGKQRELDDRLGEWLAAQPNVKCRFRPHLHAKCYLCEDTAVVTSMNLYEFSQQTNDEFGVLLRLADDRAAFTELVAEVNRIYAAAEPVTLAAPVSDPAAGEGAVPPSGERPVAGGATADASTPRGPIDPKDRVSTTKLAKRTGVGSREMFRRLAAAGLIDGPDSRGLTAAGEAAGGGTARSRKFGTYLVWPEDLRPPE